jgi:hypothetical protein
VDDPEEEEEKPKSHDFAVTYADMEQLLTDFHESQ